MPVMEPTGEAEPIFKVETERDPIYENGSRGVVTVMGTRLFAFGKEIPNLKAFKYETNYEGADGVVSTTVTMTVYGAQVETVFRPLKS